LQIFQKIVREMSSKV